MTPTKRAALAAAFLTILGGVVTGALVLTHPDGETGVCATHVAIPWPDGKMPEGWACFELDGLSSPPARQTFGLCADGGAVYAHLRIGVDLAAWDGGEQGPTLPEGYATLESTEKQVAPELCVNRFEAWLPSADAPFGCACAPADETGTRLSDSCEVVTDGGWQPAPPRVHFTEGTWRGGCFPKACAEQAGSTSWPTPCGPESL